MLVLKLTKKFISLLKPEMYKENNILEEKSIQLLFVLTTHFHFFRNDRAFKKFFLTFFFTIKENKKIFLFFLQKPNAIN